MIAAKLKESTDKGVKFRELDLDDEGGSDAADGKQDEADQFDDAASSVTALDDTKRQLEELQLRTIYTMVEPIQVCGVLAHRSGK